MMEERRRLNHFFVPAPALPEPAPERSQLPNLLPNCSRRERWELVLPCSRCRSRAPAPARERRSRAPGSSREWEREREQSSRSSGAKLPDDERAGARLIK